MVAPNSPFGVWLDRCLKGLCGNSVVRAWREDAFRRNHDPVELDTVPTNCEQDLAYFERSRLPIQCGPAQTSVLPDKTSEEAAPSSAQNCNKDSKLCPANTYYIGTGPLTAHRLSTWAARAIYQLSTPGDHVSVVFYSAYECNASNSSYVFSVGVNLCATFLPDIERSVSIETLLEFAS